MLQLIMKICTIIVTFNRKELLIRCLNKVLSQTIESDILIFDNNSSDGTKDYLTEQGIMPNPRIIYYYSNTNLGGAGGFSNGLKIAYEKKYDYFWLMDDDGYPKNEKSLEEVFKVISNYPFSIVNSMVIGENNEEKLSFQTANFEYVLDFVKNSKNDLFFNSISPFNGTLISKNMVEKIGYPREDFFIKGDETEYSLRAVKNGFQLITATKSLFVHPLLKREYRRFLFFKIPMKEESYWKEYYRTRNYVYIYRTYFPKKQMIKHIIHTYINCILYKNDKKRKRKFVKQALKDGKNNKFENIKIEK